MAASNLESTPTPFATDEHESLVATPKGTSKNLTLRVGAMLFALLLVASYALGQVSPPVPTKAVAHVAPRTARLEAATAMETRPPLLWPGKAPRSAEPEPEIVFTPTTLPSSAVLSPSPSHDEHVPARNPLTGVTTGFLRMPASINGVLIDGAPRKVAGGALQVTCGWHRVKTPLHPARPVNVPCGGTAML